MFKLLFLFIRCFSLFCVDCIFFSKVDFCVLGFSFDFLKFHLVSKKNLKVSFKRIFYPVSIWV